MHKNFLFISNELELTLNKNDIIKKKHKKINIFYSNFIFYY